jgi:hypothetical protein
VTRTPRRWGAGWAGPLGGPALSLVG